jgi:ABC-type Fe3+-siderophore transport system permease subunit
MEENEPQKARPTLAFAGAYCADAFVGALSVSLGSVKISFGNTLRILAGADVGNKIFQSIVMSIRLPRFIGAALGGASLSVAACCCRFFLKTLS